MLVIKIILIIFILLCVNSHFIIIFFFNDTATTEIYTLSLHDALPILLIRQYFCGSIFLLCFQAIPWLLQAPERSEEHTSELQSQSNLVCRLLLEKKKKMHSHIFQKFYCLHSYSCISQTCCLVSESSCI